MFFLQIFEKKIFVDFFNILFYGWLELIFPLNNLSPEVPYLTKKWSKSLKWWTLVTTFEGRFQK